MLRPPRQLDTDEIDQLLACDVPAHLATLDNRGFPHVTPLWFIWTNRAFYMTSIADRPPLRRLRRNPRAGVCIDLEDRERADGERPNRQVRATGTAELLVDDGAVWTTRITEKYVHGAAAADRVKARSDDERVVICVHPARLIAVASV